VSGAGKSACVQGSLLALFLLLLDQVFGGVGNEFVVGEFRLGRVDIGRGFFHFLAEARTLGGESDHRNAAVAPTTLCSCAAS
jgi:hypothetical protein